MFFFATGQNLARQWGVLENPEDRVKPWYDEHQYYSYSKFTSPMGAACSKEPCGHYTQVLKEREGWGNNFRNVSRQWLVILREYNRLNNRNNFDAPIGPKSIATDKLEGHKNYKFTRAAKPMKTRVTNKFYGSALYK